MLADFSSMALTNLLKERLISQGRKPYVIPVGGSNSLGTWGYIEGIKEIEEQLRIGANIAFDDIVVACGRGGTLVGLSLGSWLSKMKAKMDCTQALAHAILLIFKTQGYAMNTTEELEFVKEVAAATSVVLDLVYSGKAAFRMMKDMSDNLAKWEGRIVLWPLWFV
ncbi:D-cysteine desulfhydrase [Thalictrum thalictroides]|uniref:D-cysteine desulfhydrase n=1 Tax=Thalictrum thalictroides TaxID=46969 RepID=A0A7J6W9V3_THATH|nr:D-cysteine desulfhydrase [Thalictrum thalictroides]